MYILASAGEEYPNVGAESAIVDNLRMALSAAHLVSWAEPSDGPLGLAVDVCHHLHLAIPFPGCVAGGCR